MDKMNNKKGWKILEGRGTEFDKCVPRCYI